jgi:hypothetical protein
VELVEVCPYHDDRQLEVDVDAGEATQLTEPQTAERPHEESPPPTTDGLSERVNLVQGRDLLFRHLGVADRVQESVGLGHGRRPGRRR